MTATVLITGAFGRLGEETLKELLKRNVTLVCTDLETEENRKIAAALEPDGKFKIEWADLRDKQRVGEVLNRHEPQKILHLAAVVPPHCYLDPALAEEVNLDGTRNLLQAAKQLPQLERFVFCSSYSVYGSRNPHRTLELLTADTPLNPQDNYARQKAQNEADLRASGLPFSILRLASVFGLRSQSLSGGRMKYLFLSPPERRQHGIDGRDAALALSNSLDADVLERVWLIGGEAPDWTRTAAEFFDAILQAQGMKPIPERYFRQPAPQNDSLWYYEDWMDVRESQAVLRYQQHSFAEMIASLSGSEPAAPRWVLRLLSASMQRRLVKQSPFDRKRDGLDQRTHWQAACELFGIGPDQA
jgi:nucleoside-diphosphate-sugar epimerase